jgi:hypothetical protein
MFAATLAVIVASLVLQSSAGVAASPQPVAIVSVINGSAWTRATSGTRQPLSLYDWVTPGAVLDVAPPARVEIIMIDGRRYTLGGGARAKVSSTGLTTQRGPVTQESAVPRLVSLAPIAGKTPRAAGALRLRGPSVAKLNPCETVLTLRDETMLRFDPVEGATSYDIEVRDTTDRQVLARTIERPPLAVPAGVLLAGTEYVWKVQTVGAVPSATSERAFTTLDSAAETARRGFVSAIDPASRGLLGGIDFHLGLLNESIAELTAAAERAPRDRAAQRAADRARLALATACP